MRHTDMTITATTTLNVGVIMTVTMIADTCLTGIYRHPENAGSGTPTGQRGNNLLLAIAANYADTFPQADV